MKKIIRYAFTILLGVLVYPVASEFFVEMAREHGLYTSPTQTAENAMFEFSAIVNTWWFLLTLGFVAGGTVFLWGDYLFRRFGDKIRIIKPNVPTSIRIQFQAGSQNVTQLGNENISEFYADRAAFEFRGENGELLGTNVMWLCVLMFKRPTHYGQIIVDAGNARIPEYQIVKQKYDYAVVRFCGDIGNVALEIKTIPPNQ